MNIKIFFSLWLILGIFWWPQEAPAAQDYCHLHPKSIFQRANLPSEQDPRLTNILALALEKRTRLGHDALLVRILSDKQISLAQHSLVIMRHSLDDPDYLKRFIHAWIDLEEAAQWFDLSPEALANLLDMPISQSHLLYTSRALWEYLQNDPTLMQYAPPAYATAEFFGEKPDRTIPLPTSGTYRFFLGHLIRLEKAKRYHLNYRAAQWNTDSSKTREDAITELGYVLEDLIASSALSQTVYNYFQTIQRRWNISLTDVEQERLMHLSESRLHIIRSVQRDGPITVDQYLDTILRDPDHGFYTRQRENVLVHSHGRGQGEFVTMPQKHPDFGRGVALNLFRIWTHMGRPKEFAVREMGAGEGALALNVLKAVREYAREEEKAWKKFRNALRYTILEISPPAIERQKEALRKFEDQVAWIQADASRLDKLFAAESFEGVWISNELPDTFGVHKVKRIDGKTVELYVAAEQGILVETAGPVSDPRILEHLQQFCGDLEEGEERLVDLKTLQWLEEMDNILRRGYIMIFDYGEHHDRARLTRQTVPLLGAFGRAKNKHQAHYVTERDHRFLQKSAAAFDQAVAAGRRAEALEMAKEALSMMSITQVVCSSLKHPLFLSGEMDVTHNIDFEELSRKGDSLGLSPDIFATQAQYFELLFDTPQKRRAVDPALFDIAGNFKVQIFSKNVYRGEIHFDPQEPMWTRYGFANARQVSEFVDVLTATDPKWSAVIQQMREMSDMPGRPLAGISSDALFYFQKEGPMEPPPFGRSLNIPVFWGDKTEDVLQRINRVRLPPRPRDAGDSRKPHLQSL